MYLGLALNLAFVSVVVLMFLYSLESLIIYLITGTTAKKTPKKNIRQIIKVFSPKKGEAFCDLGFGDGELLEEFAKKEQVTSFGYEISFFRYFFSKLRFRRKKSKNQIKLIRGNFLKHNFLKADMIFCSLSKKAVKQLKKVLKEKQSKTIRILLEAHPISSLTPTNIYTFGPLYNKRKYYYYVISNESF